MQRRGFLKLLGACVAAAAVPVRVAKEIIGRRTFFVSAQTGNDLLAGDSVATAWKSIEKVMAVVGPGDTVMCSGTFTAKNVIEVPNGEPGKPITICGLNIEGGESHEW